MSRSALLLLSTALVLAPAVGAAPVPAGPKVDDTPAASAVKLLEHRKVQKELKMTAEQRIALVDGLADLDEEHEKKLDALVVPPNGGDEQFEKLDREHRKAVDKFLTDTVTKSLTAAQRKRLQQLDWHVRGVAAFTDPRVAKLLQLTEAQQKKAAELAERQKGAADRFFDDPNNEDEAKRKANLFASRKDFQKQMEDALTADQKAGWKALLGDAPTVFAATDLWFKIEEDSDPVPPTPGG